MEKELVNIINVVTYKNGRIIEVKSYPYSTTEEYESSKIEAGQYLLLKALELDFDDCDRNLYDKYLTKGYKSYYGDLFIQIIESTI
jgi:hypothetical protein